MSAVIPALRVSVWRKEEFSAESLRIGAADNSRVWLRGELLIRAPLVVFLTPVTEREREGERERERAREREEERERCTRQVVPIILKIGSRRGH